MSSNTAEYLLAPDRFIFQDEKATCVPKGIQDKQIVPPANFGSPLPVYRWGKQTSEPTHRFDFQRFESLKKQVGPREAMARALVVRR